MEYLVVPDKKEFDQYASGHEIEVTVILGWMERDDYRVGTKIEVWFQSKVPANPCFVGEIIENLGVVEHIVEDNNRHCFRIRKCDES